MALCNDPSFLILFVKNKSELLNDNTTNTISKLRKIQLFLLY